MIVLEKRTMDRYNLHLPAILTLENEAGKKVSQKLVTQNACSGGCYCETNSAFSLGTEVKMSLLVAFDSFKEMDDQTSQIAVSGKIVRRDKKGIAVRFNRQFKITLDKLAP